MYLLKEKLTIKEVAEALSVYEQSAKELLEGTIEFETEELIELAQYKGITLNELLLHEV